MKQWCAAWSGLYCIPSSQPYYSLHTSAEPCGEQRLGYVPPDSPPIDGALKKERRLVDVVLRPPPRNVVLYDVPHAVEHQSCVLRVLLEAPAELAILQEHIGKSGSNRHMTYGCPRCAVAQARDGRKERFDALARRAI